MWQIVSKSLQRLPSTRRVSKSIQRLSCDKKVSKSMQRLPWDKKSLKVYTTTSMRQITSQSLYYDCHGLKASQSLYNDSRVTKRVSKSIQRLLCDKESNKVKSVQRLHWAKESLRVYATTAMWQRESQCLYNDCNATNKVSKLIQRQQCDKKSPDGYTTTAMWHRLPCDKESLKVSTKTVVRKKSLKVCTTTSMRPERVSKSLQRLSCAKRVSKSVQLQNISLWHLPWQLFLFL